MAKVFISYSHRDEPYKNALVEHLETMRDEGLIQIWHDRKILAGAMFDDAIDDAMASADVILLLVSAPFLASKYCSTIEITNALARHKAGTSTVIPVIIKPCDWKNSRLSGLLAVPHDGRPIVEWPHEDSAYLDVAMKIRAVLTDRSAAVSKQKSRPRLSLKQLFLRFPPRATSVSLDFIDGQAKLIQSVSDSLAMVNVDDDYSLKIFAKRCGYLTILAEGTSGRLRVLVPNNTSRKDYLQAGETIIFPRDLQKLSDIQSAGESAIVFGDHGIESVMAILSEQPVIQFVGIPMRVVESEEEGDIDEVLSRLVQDKSASMAFTQVQVRP